MSVQNISCLDLQEWQKQNKDILIIDVRQKWEIDICSFGQFMHVPLDNLPDSLDKIEEAARDHEQLIIACHHGVRSYHACQWLMSQNITNVINLQGGIDQWSQDCDPEMAKY